MGENRTKLTDILVDDYISRIDNVTRLNDAARLLEIMKDVTRSAPAMWGTSMVGFGSYHYKYASGHEGDTFRVGFSARKAALVLYGLVLYDHYSSNSNSQLIEKLGTYKAGKGCIYVKSLDDLNIDILKQMISYSYNNSPSNQ
jgi:Domain of unknown function (DU1801)